MTRLREYRSLRLSVFDEDMGTNGVEWRYSKRLSLASNPAKLQLELHASSESDAPLPADWFTNDTKGYVSYMELSAAGRQLVLFSTAATSARFDRSQTVKASVLSNLYVGVRNDTTGDVISIGPVKKDGSDRYVWNAEAEKVAGFLSGAASGANDWTFVLFDISKRDGENPLGESITKAERGKLLEMERDAQRNVKSDWNATTGDAQILNKPTMGSASTKDIAVSDADVGLSTSEKLILGKYFGNSAKLDITTAIGTTAEGSKVALAGGVKSYVDTKIRSAVSSVRYREEPSAGQASLVKRSTNKLSPNIIPVTLSTYEFAEDIYTRIIHEEGRKK